MSGKKFTGQCEIFYMVGCKFFTGQLQKVYTNYTYTKLNRTRLRAS